MWRRDSPYESHLLGLFYGNASCCSLVPIEPFLVDQQSAKSGAPPAPKVELIRFDAGYENALMDGSCEGNGLLVIQPGNPIRRRDSR
jgi:hypothetical protein